MKWHGANKSTDERLCDESLENSSVKPGELGGQWSKHASERDFSLTTQRMTDKGGKDGGIELPGKEAEKLNLMCA